MTDNVTVVPEERGVDQPPLFVDPHREAREEVITNAALDSPFVVMNILATIIACYGLLENSAAVVIGAMLIAMLMGPIAGIALALVEGNSQLLTRALAAETAGVLLVLLVSFTLGKIHRDLPIGSQILSRTSPNIMDLLIALAGGAAGAYATLTPKLRASLVGVAISTALVPPLSVCGICLARGETALAWGGFLLFFANFVAIQFAFSLVLGLFGLYRTQSNERKSRHGVLIRHIVSIALLIVLAVVLESSFSRSVEQQQSEASIRAALAQGLRAYPGAQLVDVTFDYSHSTTNVIAVVRASGAVSPVKVAALQAQLPSVQHHAVTLQVRSVITKIADANSYLANSQEDNPATTPVSPASATGTDMGPTTGNVAPTAPSAAP